MTIRQGTNKNEGTAVHKVLVCCWSTRANNIDNNTSIGYTLNIGRPVDQLGNKNNA
ncbi:hypothetical protein KDA_52940 [Dictyobacter alpinus]|uniref:Uncharacterized protein n=1 Tax=Dictyobacter alpinus TaxID=2014873 RepID=A0A402BET4_9CHLR|nr:hypothetical protein KDA_52940 [Dictyobacter alpinus]